MTIDSVAETAALDPSAVFAVVLFLFIAVLRETVVKLLVALV